ncbi:MAG TPA: hypothetical protein VGS80_11820 [Ktedonobacterales bacterium]|nr:hypothetical protein [Ktedonobacterales bacterium]
MSSVLDTIRRVFGRDRGQRPASSASNEAALPSPTGAAAPAMPAAAGEPVLATPGEEAELPIQSTAPPPILTPSPVMSTPPAWTETPVDASVVTASTVGEPGAEATGQASEATAEPLGQWRAHDLSAPVGPVEETDQPGGAEERLLVVAGQATVIEETVRATVVEEPVAELEGQEQAVEDAPLAPAESTASPASLKSLESTPAALPTQPEETPEQQTAVELLAQDETQ